MYPKMKLVMKLNRFFEITFAKNVLSAFAENTGAEIPYNGFGLIFFIPIDCK
jgi:hypothetical protein